MESWITGRVSPGFRPLASPLSETLAPLDDRFIMPKKYVSQEEAAARLGVSVDELKAMREEGAVRGFADRGTWKFKFEDIEELARSRQATSDPEIPLLSDSAIDDDEDEVGSQATVIRGGGSVLDDDGEPVGPSDSDVRLILDDSLGAERGGSGLISDSDVPLSGDSTVRFVGGSGIDVDNELAKFDDADSDVRASASDLVNTADSDSDVRLVGTPDPSDDNSDSDVRLIGSDSDSDVRLAPSSSGLLDSDSDVQLVADPDSGSMLAGSDSDVKLISSGSDTAGSDSDVKLIGSDVGLDGSDSDVQLIGEDRGDRPGSDSDVALVAGDGSGLFIGDDEESSIFATDDDEPEDAGRTIAAKSGLLSPDDSGINLEVGGGGSGIILEDEGSGPAYAPSAIGKAEDYDDDLILGDDESEITLADDPSSIALDGDSIRLEADSDIDATMPELDAGFDDEDDEDRTGFEIPLVDDDDEDGQDTFQLDATATGDSNVIEFDDEEADGHAATVVRKGSEIDDDAEETFDLSRDEFESDEFDDEFDEFDDEFDDDELEVSADIDGEDDELDDLDVFDEADDFEEDFEVGGTSPVQGVAFSLEPEWGVLPFLMLSCSFIVLSLGGMMMYDLVRNMWAAGGPTATGTGLLDWFANTLFS